MSREHVLEVLFAAAGAAVLGNAVVAEMKDTPRPTTSRSQHKQGKARVRTHGATHSNSISTLYRSESLLQSRQPTLFSTHDPGQREPTYVLLPLGFLFGRHLARMRGPCDLRTHDQNSVKEATASDGLLVAAFSSRLRRKPICSQ